MSDAPEEPDFLSIHCPACQAKLRVRAKLEGTSAKCPRCGRSIAIPHRPEIELEDKPALVAARDGEYGLAGGLDYRPDDNPDPLPAAIRPPAPQVGYLDQLERVSEQRPEQPPKFLFFSGVFEFPWYQEVWLRWVYLVMGGAIATLIPIMALTFLSGASGYMGVGLAFFAMPQIWMTIWTGSFAAACGLQVFDDTAAGSQRVTGWPEPNWREWMWPLMYLGYIALMVFAVAYGVGLAAGETLPAMLLAIGLTEFFFFPLCLLSVMEANNLAVLISPGVIGSLFRHARHWFLFYLLSGLLFAFWMAIAWAAYQIHPALLILANGVCYATVTFIWFRLLGRLAWVITHRRSRRRSTVSG